MLKQIKYSVLLF